jgi:hypothetical protein
MTTAEIGTTPTVPVAPTDDDTAPRRGRRRAHRGLLALGLANWALVGVAMWSREDLVRREVLAHQPPVDPGFVGVATGSALFTLFVGIGFVLAVIQLGARFADGQISRLWDRDSRGRATVARLTAGLTVATALIGYVTWAPDDAQLGAAVPLFAAPAFALLGHLPSLRQWRAANRTGRVTSVVVTIVLSIVALLLFGR